MGCKTSMTNPYASPASTCEAHANSLQSLWIRVKWRVLGVIVGAFAGAVACVLGSFFEGFPYFTLRCFLLGHDSAAALESDPRDVWVIPGILLCFVTAGIVVGYVSTRTRRITGMPTSPVSTTND